MLRALAAFFLVLTLAAAAPADDDDPRPFDSARDASAQIDDALARASESGRGVLLIYGANWCHDSRGLAGKIERDVDLGALIDAVYEIEYVDVGERDRNLDQLARFGVEHIFGTPTLLVVDPSDGSVMNAATAHDWRMADDATAADVTAYLAAIAGVDFSPGGTRWADVDRLAEEWSGLETARAAIAAYAEERRAALDPADAEAVAALEAELARREAFALGYARSYARFAMGRVSRRDGYAVIDGASLEETPEATDVTADVAAYMESRATTAPEDFGADG